MLAAPETRIRSLTGALSARSQLRSSEAETRQAHPEPPRVPDLLWAVQLVASIIARKDSASENSKLRVLPSGQMPNSTPSLVFYSVLSEESFERARFLGWIDIPVRHPERFYWNQCNEGAELILVSSTIPTTVLITSVTGRGILSTPFYGESRATLAVYFRVKAQSTVPLGSVLFRFAQAKIFPLNDLGLYGMLKTLPHEECGKASGVDRHPDELLPVRLADDTEFTLFAEQRDSLAIAALAGNHPFGLARGYFEFVLSRGGRTIGAIQVVVKQEHFVHHLERTVFGASAPEIGRQSISITRMFGPSLQEERREVHRGLLKGLMRVAPYLLSEPTLIIDCASYDYVPALLDEGFQFESSGKIYDAFYYWKPVFLPPDKTPRLRSRIDMTSSYQSVKNLREHRKHYGVRVNDRYWYLIAQRKMWCLKKSVTNNGVWRSLRPGDIIIFSFGGRKVGGYGVIEDTFQNREPSLSEYPLGVRFKEVFVTDKIDLSVEAARTMGTSEIKGGIYGLNLEFSSLALNAIRTSRGGDKMWVVPNPLLISETDIEVTENEIFVVMPWAHRLNIYKIISDVCASQGFTATYAAETSGQVVMEDIWRLLNRARAVVVDFTGQRPNVYLEFGMAIVLGKPIIAITQKQEDCPSDVRNIKYILYPLDHAEAVLRTELPKALRDTIQQVERLALRRGS